MFHKIPLQSTEGKSRIRKFKRNVSWDSRCDRMRREEGEGGCGESGEELWHVHLKFVYYSFWFFFRIGSGTSWKVGTKSFRIHSTALNTNSRQNSIPELGIWKGMSHKIPGIAGCGERRVKAGARRVTRSCGSCSVGSAGPPASAAAPRNPSPVPPHSGELPEEREKKSGCERQSRFADWFSLYICWSG